MEESEEIIPSFPLGSGGGERKADIDQKITHQPPKTPNQGLGDPGLRHWEWYVCVTALSVLHNVIRVQYVNSKSVFAFSL